MAWCLITGAKTNFHYLTNFILALQPDFSLAISGTPSPVPSTARTLQVFITFPFGSTLLFVYYDLLLFSAHQKHQVAWFLNSNSCSLTRHWGNSANQFPWPRALGSLPVWVECAYPVPIPDDLWQHLYYPCFTHLSKRELNCCKFDESNHSCTPFHA
jgi:hypothetical protein